VLKPRGLLCAAFINPYCRRGSRWRPSRPNNKFFYWQLRQSPSEENDHNFWSRLVQSPWQYLPTTRDIYEPTVYLYGESGRSCQARPLGENSQSRIASHRPCRWLFVLHPLISP
jgi:hypothetical protein